jgi:predicted permease
MSISPRFITTTDIRHAARAVASRPGLAFSLIVTLGGGIALATVMFSVLNAVLLVPPPYRDPDRLLTVWEHHLTRNDPRQELSPANFLDLRARNRTLDGLAARSDGSVNLTGEGEAERLSGQLVTWNYLQVLGVSPARGRGFEPADEYEGGAPVALISARLWTRRFQSDPAIVGRSIRLDDKATTVVGVMGANFVAPGSDADVWLPMRVDARARNERTGHYLQAIGRLKADAGLEAARADLDRVMATLEREVSNAERNVRTSVSSLRDQLSGAYRPTMVLLQAAVTFVLLMACANAANLLLARAASRRREMAIRQALGADRWRLRAQVLTESLLVAGVAGILGVVVSLWGITAIGRVLPASLGLFAGANDGFTLTGDALEITLGWRVLLFSLGATVATGLLFGAMPARQAAGVSAHDVLRETRTTGAVRARTRKMLVIAQLAIAVILLTGAGLMLRSVARLGAIDPGFDPNGVLTMRMVLSSESYAAPHARRRFYDEVVERVRQLPAVEAAGFSTFLPLTFEGLGGGVAIESRPVPEVDFPVRARFRLVTHDYLQALGVSLRAGRTFHASDTAAAPRVAVVSEAFARSLWADNPSRALGQRIKMFGSATTPEGWMMVVGIIGSMRQSRLDTDPPLEVFALQAQGSPFPFAEPRDLAVRVSSATGDPLALAPAIRAIIRDIAPEQPVTDVRLLTNIVRQGTADRRLYLWVLGTFAALTLALAAFGLASVMSYVITARRSELSLRLALGARPRQIAALVVGECAALVAGGLAIGLGVAALAARAMRAWLFETAPADPMTMTIVAAVFATCCLAACAVPLWRSTKADPVAALRAE